MDNQNYNQNPYTHQPQYNQPKKPKKEHKFGFGFLTGFLVMLFITICLGIVGLGAVLMVRNGGSTLLSGIMGEEYSDSKLDYIREVVEKYYLEDVDDEKWQEGIYHGAMESLGDPYSEYYTEEEYSDLLVSLTGDYAGVGALLQKNAETGTISIVKVYEGTPAEEAGLKKGDIIIDADGYPATDESLDLFVQHIRGKAGTDVMITISRDGKELKFNVTRESITVPTVEYQMLEGNMGYIEVSQFSDSTDEDFIAAVKDLDSQGMKGLIIDLRDNGGGMVDSTVNMLDFLLPEGTVVYTENKSGTREDFKSDKSAYEIPLVVLVNENSASASEIFAGAIRDFKAGTLIGTTTFGKGIVQTSMQLPDGSALKITTDYYYLPSGECIHKKGIDPDIEMEMTEEEEAAAADDITKDKLIERAIKELQ